MPAGGPDEPGGGVDVHCSGNRVAKGQETMNTENRPASVAILAVRESIASVVFGMYDTFISAGRDWRLAMEGSAAPGLIRPVVAAAETAAFVAANDVRIVP